MFEGVLVLTIGSLCTGYGGLDMAVERVFDARTIWTCDADRDVQHLHGHNHPEVPMYGDLRAINWGLVPRVDVLTAGYPCQPFSLAGARGGKNDERHIFPYIAEGIRVLRPGYVVLENVQGHLSLGFDSVLRSLAELGFDAGWCVVRASDVGLPHRRSRLFVVARNADGSRRTRGKPIQHPADRPIQACEQWCTVNAVDWQSYEPAIRRCHDIYGCVPYPWGDNPKRPSPAFVEWMMGVPRGLVTDPAKWSDWTTTTGRRSRGGHVRSQLKMLGNGVCPPQGALGVSMALEGCNNES